MAGLPPIWVEASAAAPPLDVLTLTHEEKIEACCWCCSNIIKALLVIGAIFGLILLITTIVVAAASRHPVYSVSVAGVEGLDPAALAQPTLSPVLNLTVHINKGGGCAAGLSAVVSYGDVFLGKGSVQGFCARGRKEAERAATLSGQDVAVPRFLRERLAAEMAVGEAALDVQLTMRTGCCHYDQYTCNAKIDGGLSRCQC